MLAVFWSPSGNDLTSSMVAVMGGVTLLQQQMEVKTLVLPSDLGDSSLERAVGIDLLEVRDEGGINELERLMLSGKLSATSVVDNSLQISKGVDYLPINKEASEDTVVSLMPTILNAGKSVYEAYFTMVGSNPGKLGNYFLDSAELVIVCLTQNEYLLERNVGDIKRKFEGKKVIYCVVDFERTSYLSLPKISSKFGIPKKDLFCIPRSVKFMDHINKRSSLLYVMKASTVKPRVLTFSDEYLFSQSINKLTRKILEKLEVFVSVREDKA